MWNTKRSRRNATRVGPEVEGGYGPGFPATTTSVCRGRALEPAATEMIR